MPSPTCDPLGSARSPNALAGVRRWRAAVAVARAAAGCLLSQETDMERTGAWDQTAFVAAVEVYCAAARDAERELRVWRAAQLLAAPPESQAVPAALRFARWLHEHGRISG